MTIRNKIKVLLSTVLLLLGSFFLWTGCGSPPEGPGIEPGSLTISTYFDSSWTDTVGVLHPDSGLIPSGDTIIVEVDGDSNRIYFFTVNPFTLTELLPGVHKIDIAWQDYTTSFSATVAEAETIHYSPVMTQFAPDFTLPGMFFDQIADTLARDTVTLSDYRGEVVLLFYFTAG
jgi:hypothetical protein